MLKEAEALSSTQSGTQPDPIVHLGQALRVQPTKFHDAIRQIYDAYREGRVVILDLAKTDERIASRVIDFCSGMSLVSIGSMHHVSSFTIVITPRVN